MRNSVSHKGELPIIELVDLFKQFDDKIVLQNLNLTINKGDFLTLLGPSGSGKTTTLRLIAGFDYPTRGEIKFNGKDIKDLPPHKRPTKTIFQDYALFPNLNVENNIKYGMKLIRVSLEEIDNQHKKKLANLTKKWKNIVKNKIKQLDKEQANYEKIMSNHNPNSRKFIKAQKWLDSSDFRYSAWENYINIKTKKFSDRYLTRSMTAEEIDEETKKMISLIGLEGNEKKTIFELSGGMKQRVALARSLVLKPEVLLLDEPLSALDLKVRQKMQRELKDIQQKLNLTFVLVTHDQEEALTLSNKVAVMRDGAIEQFGKPQEIYDFPKNAWLANFIGESNIFEGTILENNKIEFLKKQFDSNNLDILPGTKVDIMLRPEDIIIETNPEIKGKFKGKIKKAMYQGKMWDYEIVLQIKNVDKKIKVKATTPKKIEPHTTVSIDWDLEDLHPMIKERSK